MPERDNLVGAFQGLLVAGFCTFAGFLFSGAGHGTMLPMLMYVGPLGLGLIAAPIAYAAAGAKRRLLLAFFVVIIAFCAHAAGAALVYILHPDMQNQIRFMGGFGSRLLLCYAILAGTMDLLPATTITVKLLRTKR